MKDFAAGELLIKMWADDCKIDRLNIEGEIIRFAKIHSKYLSLYMENRRRLDRSSNELNKLRGQKRRYFRGKLNGTEELELLGWEPWKESYKTKEEIDDLIEQDDSVIFLINKKDEFDNLHETLIWILKALAQKSFDVKNIVGIRTLESGR